MDTLLIDGGFARTSTGLPQAVEGREELLQRARIRLTVPKGAFPYAPELGSALPLLEEFSPAAALDMAVQALRPLPGVLALAVRQTEEGVAVTLSLLGEPAEIGVPRANAAIQQERNRLNHANL